VSRSSSKGFTLIEIMISLLLLLTASSMLLTGLELSVRQYRLASTRWETTIQLWNRSERLRVDPAADQGGAVGCDPLCRTVLRDPSRPQSAGWEVHYDIR